MTPSIVLIGPSGAGKTTLAPLLASRLAWAVAELDKLRWDYYAQVGYDAAYADYIRAHQGLAALARYWRPFDIYGLECVLRDYPAGHVISLGAGHSVFDNPNQFARAEQALAPFPHVILLLPLPDIEESAQILRARLAIREPHMDAAALDALTAINREFMAHPSNWRLATHLIYTEGMTPDALCDAAYALVSEPPLAEV